MISNMNKSLNNVIIYSFHENRCYNSYNQLRKANLDIIAKKQNQKNCSKNLLSMPFIYAFNWINELKQLCIKTSWSTLTQNIFLRGPAFAISWTPWFWSNPSDFQMEFWSECCFIVESYQRQQMSVKKPKKLEKKTLLDLVSGQTSVRSNRPLIRLVCAWNCLWSDRPRPKWTLIRQVPDHCPDKSALEAFSRPCNSSAPRTCVHSKMVWSELNSVWPPRPGQSWVVSPN